MPCRDYDDDRYISDQSATIRDQKKKLDMLSRIACKALYKLEQLEDEVGNLHTSSITTVGICAEIHPLKSAPGALFL